MSYLIKMKGKDVYIKDMNAMRTREMSEAIQFKSEIEARKTLKVMGEDDKIILRAWKIGSPTTDESASDSMDISSNDVSDMKEVLG